MPARSPLRFRHARRRSLRGRSVKGIALSAAVVLLPALAPVVVGPAVAARADTTQVLPFTMPAQSTLRATAKKVFVNWVPALPVSLDNQAPDNDYWARGYNDPNGEGGSHAAYGGYSRDRPLGRPVRPESNWRLLDMEDQVRQAGAMGADGFSTVLYSLADTGGQTWDNNVLMMQAAAAADPTFKIILQPDMSGAIGAKTADVLAASMAQLGASSSAYRLGDGRLVISPFDAEAHPASWWSSFLSIMSSRYGMPVAFLPLFLNEQPYLDSFAPISWGMSNWGSRSPAGNDPTVTYATSPTDRVAKVHAKGLVWMQPVSVQDERPREGTFQEAGNTENLRDTWQLARQTNSELVQINTWNDYPENSQVAPSKLGGWGFMDISSYYATWYKTGAAPTVNHDTVYLTHRLHAWQAKPSFPETTLMSPSAGTAPRDTVEALTYMTQAGTVTISVGGALTTCSVPAGVGTCLAPLRPGTVSAALQRGGAVTAELVSPYTVTATPYVQDLHYTSSSSGRSGTASSSSSAPAPSPTPTATPSPTPTPAPVAPASTVSVPVTADAGPAASSPDASTGSTNYLTSRGSTSPAMGYLRFRIPAAPSGRTLTGARLVLRTTTDPAAGSSATHDVRLWDDSWTEPGITWTNRPNAGGASIGTVPAGTTSDSALSVPLSVSGLQPLLGKQTTLTLSSTGNDGLLVWTREGPSAYQPQLVLTFG